VSLLEFPSNSSTLVTGIEPVEQSEVDIERRGRLREMGIFIPPTLQETLHSQKAQPYLVESLLRDRSVNLLVGNSGLGKTPLAIQLGVCVVAGLSFLNLKVQQGRVLYCDAETDLSGFWETLRTISAFLGLTEPPLDFHIWSPNWDPNPPTDEENVALGAQLIHRVRVVKPKLVIVDPLRVFWSQAETKNEEAAAMVRILREVSRETGASWLISHHRRKANQQAAPELIPESPHAWFQEAAGAHALVNQSDTRLGVEPGSGQVDLVVAGFVRGKGAIPPLDLARVVDAEGLPIGYRRLAGIEHLRPEDRAVFDRLPRRFRFKDVQTALGGTSDSNAKRLVERCLSLGIVRKDDAAYLKTGLSMECME
jgi:AAA domain-containing protein